MCLHPRAWPSSWRGAEIAFGFNAAGCIIVTAKRTVEIPRSAIVHTFNPGRSQKLDFPGVALDSFVQIELQGCDSAFSKLQADAIFV